MKNILVLWPMKLWNTKMSCARRHSIEAIAKVANVIVSGVGWPDYNTSVSVAWNMKEIMPQADLILWYKPLGGKGIVPLLDCKDAPVPTCMRYNESAWPDELAAREVEDSGTDYVLCHHASDLRQFKRCKTSKIFHVPHCAEKSVFFNDRDHTERNVPCLLTGVISRDIYPLRERWFQLIKTGAIRGLIRKHPGYRTADNHERLEQIKRYAEDLAGSRIALVCSSQYKYPLAKYVEAAMSGCLVLGDMPLAAPPEYQEFIAEVEWTNDKSLVDAVTYWLNNPSAAARRARKGQEIVSRMFSQERYAQLFLREVFDAN